MGNTCCRGVSVDALKQKYDKAGQGHVFSTLSDKPYETHAELVDQAARLDPQFMN